MPKDSQHVAFLNNYFNSLADPDVLMEPTKHTAIRCNAAHIPPTTQGVDGVDSQIVGRHISECRKRARNQPRAERNQPWQLELLEAAYSLNHYPSAGARMILMYETNLSYRKVKNWFEQKAKMLKKAGGGPVAPNPSSNKYSTRMWKAYFADPVGYVQKLLNGEIDLVTGAAIGRAVNNFPNAPASGSANNTNGNTGLEALASGTNIVPGLEYQCGYENGEAGFSNMQPPPQNQMNQQVQLGYSNLQTPPHYQAFQQAHYEPQQMPTYTREQNEVHSMPQNQSMNSAISSHSAGRSYQMSNVQPTPQREAYPEAYAVEATSQGAAPALFDGIKQAVSDQYNYRMPANSRPGISYDLFADQIGGELKYQEHWQNRYESSSPVPQGRAGNHMPAYLQVPENPTGESFDRSSAHFNDASRKRKSMPDDDELNQGSHSTHLRKRSRQASVLQPTTPPREREFAGAEGEIRVNRDSVEILRPSRPVPTTHRRSIPGQSPDRRVSWNETDETMDSSFDDSGVKWSPAAPSESETSHGSSCEKDTDKPEATSPNIRAPNTGTPDVQGSDFRSQRLDPLLLSSTQDSPDNGMEEVSRQSLAAFKSSGPEISSSMAQGKAQDLDSSAQISPEDTPSVKDTENLEDILPVPDMNTLEHSFLQNGEFDYSAFLGNDDNLFDDWDPL